MAKRPRSQKRKPTPEPLVAASVMTSQVSQRYYTRTRPDVELIQRAINTMYAAASLNASVVSSMPLRLYRPEGSGGNVVRTMGGDYTIRSRSLGKYRTQYAQARDRYMKTAKSLAIASSADSADEVLTHPVLDLLYKPDDRMTHAQWSWLIAFWMEIAGRAYLYVGEPRPPVAMIPLAPQFVNVVGSKSTLISHYRYGRATESAVDLPAETVLYLRYFVDPADPLGATSWARSVAMQSDLESAALSAEIARWENGGLPGGVIEVLPGTITNQDELKQYTEALNSQYGGTRNANKWMILANGKVVQYGAKPHEMAYKDGLTMAEEKIWRAAGVPESIWRLNSANRASSVESDPMYMRYTIGPRCAILAEFLTEHLLPMFPGTEGWWFAYESESEQDMESLTQRTTLLVESGVMTANEQRSLLGMESGGPELDVYRYRGTALGVGDEAKEQGPAEAKGDGDPEADSGRGGDGSGGAGGVRGDDDSAVSRSASARADGIDAGARPDASRNAVDRAVVSELTCSCGECVTSKGGLVDAAADAFAAKLEAWYSKTSREAMDEDGRVTLPDTDELRRIVDRGLKDIYAAAARESDSRLGVDIPDSMIDRAAARYAAQRGGELIETMSQTVVSAVRERLVSGLTSGSSVAEIRASIADLGLPDWKAEQVVRTEMSFASQNARIGVYQEAGWEGKGWRTAGGPCPLCDAIEAQYGGKRIGLLEPFYRAGDSIVGTDGKVYTFQYDVVVGNAHPNCRCTATMYERIEG